MQGSFGKLGYVGLLNPVVHAAGIASVEQRLQEHFGH